MNYVAAAAIIICKGCQHRGGPPAPRLPRGCRRGVSLATVDSARSGGEGSSPVEASRGTVIVAPAAGASGISSSGNTDDVTHAVLRLLMGLTDAAGLRDVWRRGLPRVGALAFQLSSMLRIHTPKLLEHLARIGFHMEVLAAQWLLTLLASALPICTLARVWDVFAVDGWKMLFRTIVAILRALEPRALGMDVGDMSTLFRAWKGAIGHAECGSHSPAARALLADYPELDVIFAPDALLAAAMCVKVTRRMLAEAEEAHALHVLKQKVVAHIAAAMEGGDATAPPGTARRNSTITSSDLLGRSPRETPRTRQAQELPLMPPAAFVLRVSPFALLPSVQAQRGYKQRAKRGGVVLPPVPAAARVASTPAPAPVPPTPQQFFILSPPRPLRPRAAAPATVLRTPAPAAVARQSSASSALASPEYEGVQGWLKYMETHSSMHSSDTGTRLASCHLLQLLAQPAFHTALEADMARLFLPRATRARTDSQATDASPMTTAASSAASTAVRGGVASRPSFFGVPPMEDPPSPPAVVTTPPAADAATPLVPVLDVTRVHAPEATPEAASRRTLRSMPSFIDSPGAIERVGRRLGLALEEARAQSNDVRVSAAGVARPGFITRVRRTDSTASAAPAPSSTQSTPAGEADAPPRRVLPPVRETRTASVAAQPPSRNAGNENDYRLDIGTAFHTALSALAADYHAIDGALRNDGVALNDKIASVRSQLFATRVTMDATQAQVKAAEEIVVQLLRAKRSASRTLHDIMTQPTRQHARHAQSIKRFSALLSGLDEQLKTAGAQWRAVVWSSTLVETRSAEMRHVMDALMAQLIAMSNQAEGDKAFLFRRLWYALSIVWQHAAGRRNRSGTVAGAVAAPLVIAARDSSV